MRKNKSLGYTQRLQLNQFIDCVKRTRKKVNLTDTHKLVRFMLEESSIVDDGDNSDGRSFRETVDAIRLINLKLCPGQWCTRSHCEEYSSHRAYNCNKTRPAVCELYKKYVKGQEERDAKKKENEE